jgi:hypothetical protein
MTFRDEILRGIRLAAIVFALALLALVLHRMVNIDLSAPAVAAEQPAAVPKPAPQPAVIGGSAARGSIPPPPPGHGNAVTSIRNSDAK